MEVKFEAVYTTADRIEEALRTDPDPATPGMWALGVSLAIGAIFLSWAAWHLWIVPWATAGDPIAAP